MADVFSVIWQDTFVGYYTHGPFDMWYCDGTFQPAEGDMPALFHKKIAALNVHAVFDDWSKGIRVTLCPENDPSQKKPYLVLGFAEDALCLRLLS